MSNKINKRLKLLKRSAKKRNISVDLNVEHYAQLFSLGCSYCGKDLQDENGYCLDRLDNTKGYHFDNVLPCCKICNRAKGTMSFDEFDFWLKRAYNHQEKEREKFEELNWNLKKFKKSCNIIKNKRSYKNSKTIFMEGDR